MANLPLPPVAAKALIDGQWIEGERHFAVTNPATGATLAQVPDLDAVAIDSAIGAAHRAFPGWRDRLAADRCALLRRWYDLILSHTEDLARLVTLESGKPLAEARGEVAYGASFVSWFAEEARRAYGDIVPSFKNGARVLVTKQPVGVVSAITPWNFPVAMILRKISPALAAGCTVVLKPAAETPLSALFLASLAVEAGLPAGVVNIVTTSDAAAAGHILSTDARVRKISFTGSTAVGKILMKQGAETIKRLSLELGGNAPMIVFSSADLAVAVAGTVTAKFRNAGQTCVCINRIYVEDSVHDLFVAGLKNAIAALRVGDGMEDGVKVGPLINKKGFEKVDSHVRDAAARGATILLGGAQHPAGDLFYAPTLLTGMTDDMAIAREETFGPVAAVFRFSAEDEVIRRANATPFGLASYVYTRDMAQAFRVADALEAGMVGVNEPIVSTEIAPFGGWKESGLGREGSRHGLDEYLEKKFILLGTG